ncbi:MAG: apolipoprotein N-acyltransferase [Candidatus Eremiobacteraeota bacterium]|nr:apolipoprotein N-acyltransferase [Candidatus Eremiobacteraeota bacterium]
MRQSLTQIFLALLSGFLLGISFPDSRFSLCAWIALVPLFFALTGCGMKRAFLLSWATGFCFFCTIFQWGFLFGVPVWLAISLLEGFFMGICGALIAPFLRSTRSAVRIISPALVWVSYEYLRSLGFLGLNWGSLSYSQYMVLPLIQIAGITGMYGITLMIVLFNASVKEILTGIALRWNSGKGIWPAFRRLERESVILALLALLIPLASLCWGYGRIASDRSREHLYPRVKISTIQPSLDMCLEWDATVKRITIAALEKLTVRGKVEGGTLFFWPESAVPTYFPNDFKATQGILSFAAKHGIYLLAGAPFMGGDLHIYNSAFLISPQGTILESYSKRRLVPFSENLPWSPHLRRYSPFNRFRDVWPGAAWKTFTTPAARFGVIICFESDFPYIARINVRRGAQFLAVLTNDAWFERSSAATHHLSWSVFRALENHVNVVQSANTGISAFIDYNGRIKSSIELFRRTVLTDEIILQPTGTLYTRAGDYFPLLCLLAVPIPWIMARAGQKRNEGENGYC